MFIIYMIFFVPNRRIFIMCDVKFLIRKIVYHLNFPSYFFKSYLLSKGFFDLSTRVKSSYLTALILLISTVSIEFLLISRMGIMLASFTTSVISLAEYPSRSLTNLFRSELLRSLLIPLRFFYTRPFLESLSGRPT